MNKKTFLFVIISFILVIFLYFLSSTTLIIKDEEEIKYKIALILNDDEEKYHSNFIKGVEKAKEDFLVDVEILFLENLDKKFEQKELIEKVLRNNFDAIVLNPVFKDVDYINKQNIPFVIIDDSSYESTNKNFSSIFLDYYNMTKSLLEELEEREKVTVAYFGFDNFHNKIKLQAIEDIGKVKSLEVEYIDFSVDLDFEKEKCTSKNVLISLDKKSADLLCEDYKDTNFKLYAIENTRKILKNLSEKKEDRAVIIDEYKLGYKSISLALNMIEYKDIHTENAEYYIVTKDNIFKSKVEDILYPIY